MVKREGKRIRLVRSILSKQQSEGRPRRWNTIPIVLLNNLRSVAPARASNPNVVLLTPGQFNSAESRRGARFWNYGHTPGPMHIRREGFNPDYPVTLDLLRAPEAWLEASSGVAAQQEQVQQ
jgi:hypothetical protein